MAGKGGNRKVSERDDFNARQRIKIRVIDGVFSLLRTIFRGSIFLLGAYIIGSALAPFAGHKTELSAIIKAVVELRADRYILGLATLAATGSWWQERRKRIKLIEKWGPYVRDLEQKIDPNRSSSGLLGSGQPRKEDADVL